VHSEIERLRRENARLRAPKQLYVHVSELPAPKIPETTPIQEVFRTLAENETRNRRIAGDVIAAYREGRKILVLTERTGQLETLHEMIAGEVENCFVLLGRLPGKQRVEIFDRIEELTEHAHVFLATGRLINR